MNTSQTTEAEKPTPNIPEERAYLLDMLASHFVVISGAEKIYHAKIRNQRNTRHLTVKQT